ncbi:MAG: D-alanyl-D-alanine carboxypeptidase/D-alanyl-D-alanine-endopeptidase [Proteobacteria bacterium]|nr:MAG: D-alanyl-D-alanine carboxypeptidase/D-alanyl-D-alanine-endopeptidase [Pseudomonadota bacterium]
MKNLFWLAAAILALNPAPGFGATSLSLDQFKEKMKKHVASLPGQATASVEIEVLGAGNSLFSHNENGKIIPASNTKLITSVLALQKLGPGYTFETKIFRSGNDLVIQGNGDPYLVSERLYLLARDVARTGIKSIDSIRVSNSAYDKIYSGLMEWDDSSEPFTAMIAPTSSNFNSIEIHLIPGEGKQPKLELGPVPHSYATLINEVRMVPGRGRSISVRPGKMEGDRETFRVTGTMGKGANPATEYASVRSPESLVAHTLASLLRQEGITVKQDFGGASYAPAKGEEIASAKSLPLLDLLRASNTYSNNFMTEQVFLAYGAAAGGGGASIEKSRAGAKAFLDSKPGCAGAVMDNGSGLTWNNRISAKCFAEVLQGSYRDFLVFADLLGSLPVGGQTGTLRNRFKRVGPDIEPLRVRAKTGTLWSRQAVTSLVGITQTASGEKIAFALIENDQRNNPALLSAMRDWEDKCVEYIQQLKL